MARSSDWSALDLDEDPTPGDPDKLEALLEAQKEIIDLAADIDDGLDELMSENSSYFIGETADALREEMDNRVRKFVQSFRDAHQSVYDALSTYHGVMVTQQGIADGALSSAAGLDKEDSEWEEHQTTAKNAGEALSEAASTAAGVVSTAGSDISSMIDPCEEFWKFLTYFVLALILPAIILGGPTAVLFLTLSAVLMVKTAIDFAGGKASVAELVLSVLGMLVPTTRGLNVIGAFKSIKSWGASTWTKFSGMTFRDIVTKLSTLPKRLVTGGIAFIGGIITTTIKGTKELIRGGAWADNAIFKGLGGVDGFAGYVTSHFKGMGPSAIILPVNVMEMGSKAWSLSGFTNAFKISMFNRGVLNQYRTGAFVHGTHTIDVRAIAGFDGARNPQVNVALWSRYQPGGAATARFLGGLGAGLSDASKAPVITIGGGFNGLGTPNRTSVDLTMGDISPTGTPHSLTPGNRTPILTPNSSVMDLSVTNPPPSSAFQPPTAVTSPSVPTPANGQMVDMSLADMRPVSPISVHMAETGTRMGVPDLAPPSPQIGSVEGMGHMPGDLYVAPPASVVTHMPSPGGQVVGVEMPLLSQVDTPTPAVPGGQAVNTGGAGADVSQANVGSLRFDQALDTGRMVGADGVVTELPAVNVTGMQQLGETMAVPPVSTAPPRAETGAVNANTAAINPATVPQIGTSTGVTGGVGGKVTGDLGVNLTHNAPPPLRVGFADQGMGMAAPDASQIGNGARVTSDFHTAPVEGAPGRTVDQTTPGTGVTDTTGGVTPTPVRGDNGGASLVDLGDGAARAAGDVPLARPLGGIGHVGGETSGAVRATSTPPPPSTVAPTLDGTVAAPVRQPRGGGLEGEGAGGSGIQPVRLESIDGRTSAPADGIAASVPPPVTRAGGGEGGADNGALGLAERPGGHGPGVVPVENIVVTHRPAASAPLAPPPAAAVPPPALIPRGAGGGEANGFGLFHGPGNGATPPPADPVRHLIAALDDAPAAPVGAPARGAEADGGGVLRPDSRVELLGQDGAPTGVTVVGRGEGAPTLLRGDTQAPGEVRILPDALTVRGGDSVTLHDHAGAYLGGLNAHRSGPLAGHAVVTSLDGPPRLVTLGGQPVAGASISRVGDLGWAVVPPGAPRGAVVDTSGAHTHDLVPLRGGSGDTAGGFAAVPRAGGEVALVGRGGDQLPNPAQVVGDSLLVQRKPGTVDFHSLDGDLLSSAHGLPGRGGHELMTPAGGRPAHVLGPDGQLLDGAGVRPFGDGLLVERPGHRAVVMDGDGVHTHDAFRFTHGGEDWMLAVPQRALDGKPVLVRDVGGAFTDAGPAVRLGAHGTLVRLGDGAFHLVDAAGGVTPAVRLIDRAGQPTELIHTPPTGTAGGAVYRTDGRLLTDDVLAGFDGNRVVVRTGATYSVHGADGTFLGSGAARAGGPLGEGNRLDVPVDGGPARVVDASGAPVRGATVHPAGDGGHLVQVPGQRPGVVDASGAHTHDVFPLRGGNGASHGLGAMPLRDGGAPLAFRPDGTPTRGVGLTHDGDLLIVGREGGAGAVYDMGGRFAGLRRGVDEGPLAGHTITLLPGTGAHRVADASGALLDGATVTRFGPHLFLAEVPGKGAVLLDRAGLGTQPVVPVPVAGGADRLVALPAGAGRSGPLDGAWLDGAVLRRELPDGTADFVAADGSVLGRALPVTSGPLDGRVFLIPEGAPPRLVEADGRAVPDAEFTPLGSGGHLLSTDGGMHHLIEPGGTDIHRVIVLTGRPGEPDMMAVVRSQGEIYPHPRGADGVTLTDHTVRRVDPTEIGADGRYVRGAPKLVVYTPDSRAVSHDLFSGAFRSDQPSMPGAHRVTEVDYRLLTAEDRAVVHQYLMEAAKRPAPPTPDIPRTLIVGKAMDESPLWPAPGGASGSGHAGGAGTAGHGASFAPDDLRIAFDPDTGRVARADLAGSAAGADAPVVRVEATPDGDLVRVTRGGAEIHTERWVSFGADLRGRLTGGDLTLHRVTPDGGLAAVDDAVTPLADGSGFHLALPDGHRAVDHAGATTHTVLPLRPAGGGPAADHVFTPVGGAGGAPALLDAAGNPRPGALDVTADAVTIRRGQTTDIHDPATGALDTRVHHLTEGQWNGYDLRVPDTGHTPGARPALDPPPGRPAVEASVDVLTDGRFRVQPPTGTGQVIGADGTRLGDNLPLRHGPDATGEHVVVPARPAGGETAWLESAGGGRIAGSAVDRVGDGFHVRRLDQPDTVALHGADGALVHVAQRVRVGPAFDGAWLATPVAGGLRVVDDAGGAFGARAVPRGDDLLLVSDDAVAGVTRAGAPTEVTLPLRNADGTDSPWTLHTPPGGQPQVRNATTHAVVGGDDVRIVGGALEVRHGDSAFTHGTDGSLLSEAHRVRGAGDELDGVDLVVPHTPGGVPHLTRGGAAVPGGSATPLGDHGYLVRAGGAHGVVDDTGAFSHRLVETTLPDGTTGLVAWSQRPGGRHFFVNATDEVGDLGVRFHPAIDDQFTVTRGGSTFEYRADAMAGGGFAGQLLRESHPITGGPVPGRTLVVPHDGQPPQIRTPGEANREVTPQHWGGFDGFRIDEGGGRPHTVVDGTGRVTHTAVPLTPRPGTADPFDAWVFRPADGAAGGGPVLRTAGGAEHTADFRATSGRYHVSEPGGGGITRVHEADGRFVEERLTLNGGALDGHRLHLPENLDNARITPPGGNARPVAAVPQTDGALRVGFGDHHLIIDPATGGATHRVISFSGSGAAADTHAWVRLADDAVLPAPRAADGTEVAGAQVVRAADGDLRVTRTGTAAIDVFSDTGALRFQARPLTGGNAAEAGDFVRVYEMTYKGQTYRAYDVVDDALTPRAGRAAVGRQATPTDVDLNGGFRVRDTGDGRVWVFGRDGRLEAHLGAAADGTRIRTLTTYERPAGGGAIEPRTVRVVEMGDAKGRRFAEIEGGRAVRDVDLAPMPGRTTTATDGGGFRYTGDARGLRGGEYRQYAADGRLLEQRINVIHRGQHTEGEFYLVRNEHDAGGKVTGGSWERWRGGAAPPDRASVLDRGRVDPKGASQGHVFLLTENALGVRGHAFERRPMPTGDVLDAHAPGTVTGFVKRWHDLPVGTSQRERWQKVSADGNAAGDGIRVWGTSRRTFYDYRDEIHVSRSIRGPEHHYRETPQGGYVFGVRGTDSGAPPRNGAVGRWYRFDSDLGVQATGNRHIGLASNGWRDEMPDPRLGSAVEVNEKVGRLGWHGLRTFRAEDLGTDGLPTRGVTAVSPQGKDVRSVRTMPNGDELHLSRNAEQRPPNFYRALLSPEFRNMDMTTPRGRFFALPHPFLPRENRYVGRNGEAAWVNDSRLQTFDYQIYRDGRVVDHGVQVVTTRGFNTTLISHNGRIAGETRELPNGNKLVVGPEVKMPDGVERRDGYLPWTQGDGKLSGHRTFRPDDFVDPPAATGKTREDVVWQDQFRADLPAGGNWYTRDAGQVWHANRMGFKDGTILDFRPPPRAGGQVGDGGLDFQRTVHAGADADWSLLTHQGKLIGRADTWLGAGADGAAIRVVSRYGGGRVSWSVEGDDALTGGRNLASRNQFDHHQYFDRESFRDYATVNGQRELIREFRLLSDDTGVMAWKTRGADGGPDVWQWNKVDRFGNVMEFGEQGQRVRWWSDDMRRWEDRLMRPDGGYTVVQELPVAVGSAIRQAFNDSPLRVREYFPDAASLGTVPRTLDDHRGLTWKEFESGAVARRKVPWGDDGTYMEIEAMTKQWRRWGYDAETGRWQLLGERSVAGYVRELPAESLAGGPPFTGDLRLIGRETYFFDVLNEFRTFERMYRQPRRTPWGSGVEATGESTYTPFALRNFEHMAIEFAQEFVLDFGVGMAIYAAMPGDFGLNDVAAAALRALVGASVKAGFIGLHNFAAHHSQFRVGLNWQDRGFPYRHRQDDDDTAGEWASNEFVLRWRGGTYDFFKDGFVVAPLGSFLGTLVAAEALGVKGPDGEWHDVSLGQAAALAGATALGTVVGGLATGALKAAMQNTMGARWYHRQGVMDFVVVPVMGKFIDKPLGQLVFGPEVRDMLGVTSPVPPPPPETPPVPDASGEPETTSDAPGENP
ncbi:hypothetical protein SAMN06297387_11416 [Streptomyces zhaozhouensis]|uniref:Uncharacterized protein n=1 Tax=Streptomyces zhaozhouensis TaxID=1300267 RepID=A0A286DZF1_9ACTN|nr:hypothetical protein [Streptomyces zhaozhouensis]SOD64037.1 hypothetical protein SAMN06297387_11416 [Streptomyces zhaozhouensis]